MIQMNLMMKRQNETEQRFANQNLGNALQENKQIKRNLEQENAINPSAECSASGMAAVSATTACLNQEQVCSRQVIPRELPVFNGKPEEWPDRLLKVVMITQQSCAALQMTKIC